MLTSLLLFHVCCAVIGLLSGFLAVGLRKGSGWHGAAGNVFFTSMLGMTGSAAVLAIFYKVNRLNQVVSLLTFYLVVTAWRAARRRDGGITIFDKVALVWILFVSALGLGAGIEAMTSARGMKHGIVAPIYFVFGTIALLCAMTDMRMIKRGGVAGAERIARHLWRMCLALLIATLSFFPGQARHLPAWFRQTSLVYVPHILLIGAMLFWIYRIKVRKRVRRNEVIVLEQSDPAVWQLDEPVPSGRGHRDEESISAVLSRSGGAGARLV